MILLTLIMSTDIINKTFVRLQDFAIDLYPFYPPLVKVIRPRLEVSQREDSPLMLVEHLNEMRRL